MLNKLDKPARYTEPARNFPAGYSNHFGYLVALRRCQFPAAIVFRPLDYALVRFVWHLISFRLCNSMADLCNSIAVSGRCARCTCNSMAILCNSMAIFSDVNVFNDSHAFGRSDVNVFNDSHAFGRSDVNVFNDSHAFRRSDVNVFNDSHAFGRSDVNVFNDSHAFRRSDVNVFNDSHAFGRSGVPKHPGGRSGVPKHPGGTGAPLRTPAAFETPYNTGAALAGGIIPARTLAALYGVLNGRRVGALVSFVLIIRRGCRLFHRSKNAPRRCTGGTLAPGPIRAESFY